MCGVLGQVECGLARGVGPADDECVLTRDGWRQVWDAANRRKLRAWLP